MDRCISVIVPVYNTKDFLEQCVQSILSQTYKNLEVLLVDDGSTDGSAELCDALSEQDARITVIHKPNGGASSARNAGLDAMRGEFVLFVDSDDYIHPQMCEVLVGLIGKYDADISMCFSRGTKMRDYAEPPQPSYREQCLTGIQAMELLYGGDAFSFFGYNPTSNMFRLYKRSLFGSDLRYDENAVVAEDDTMTPYLLARADRIASVDRRMYYIYERPGSLSRSGISDERWKNICETKVRMYTERLRAFEDKEKFRSLVRMWYSIALFDLAEAYNMRADKACRRTLKSCYNRLLRQGMKKHTFDIKRTLIFCAIYMNPRFLKLF